MESCQPIKRLRDKKKKTRYVFFGFLDSPVCFEIVKFKVLMTVNISTAVLWDETA
jgi:hypothetical protein